MPNNEIALLVSIIILIMHSFGILNAAHAVMNVRSSQGAIAWAIALITFPWLAIPLYWVLGRNKFHGYAEAMRKAYVKHQELVNQAYQETIEFKTTLPPHLEFIEKLAETFAPIPFTSGNSAELLINGEQTFDAMLKAIASAKHYILMEFYIINDDKVGNEFKKALIAKAEQGVKVYVLYDEIGSQNITRSYIKSLRNNGILVNHFHTTKGKGNRFQLNFRNHRKILVIDGQIGFVGGLNIGDEYLGKNPKLSPWRDTHMSLQGPSVEALQSIFLQDWYWATAEIPEVCWQVEPNLEANETAFIFPKGPADTLPTCTLFYSELINQARQRIWIASPYFVPDDSTLNALKLAAIRGLDVRIILPNRPDHLFVYLCSFSYYDEMRRVGVKLYRYKPGFMHQKIILIDQDIAGVGTINLDNRSFFLNFEVMGFLTSSRFVATVEKMLQDDLASCRKVELAEYNKKSLWFKLAVRVSRLMAPIL